MSGSEVVASNTPVLEQVAQEPASSTADAGATPVESHGTHEKAPGTAEAAEGATDIKEVSVGDLEREVSTDASNLCATHSRELIAEFGTPETARGARRARLCSRRIACSSL
jgi:hypothetical protein